MAEESGRHQRTRDLLLSAWNCWRQNQLEAALDAVWAAFALAPNECAPKALAAKLLRYHPDMLCSERRADYLRLLTDRKVEPDPIGKAGWRLLLRSHRIAANASEAAIEALTAELEVDELALTLLRESPVSVAAAERLLNRLRRWLLLSGQWRRHPEIVAALKVQANLNGGAWPFDESEREMLAELDSSPMIEAYLPIRGPKKTVTAADSVDPITRAVKAQYEGWPYPPWTRVTVGEARRLPDVIRRMDPKLAEALPIEANMLIAGCGTGRQAASVALHYPDAIITAIDISEASLDHARRQCAALGVANVRFLKLDLHDVTDLNERFHAIHCGGVLQHLPDPERGFELLADILHPGGVMKIMIYNRHQRLLIDGARTFLIGDLLQEPVTDDLLRRVRQRFLQLPEHPAAAFAMRSRDFATLAGTHDLLLHVREDPFDLARLERALDRAGLRMLSFRMPTPISAARYDAMFPDDPMHRDIKSFARFELSEPSIAQRHYRFWCYLPSRTP